MCDGVDAFTPSSRKEGCVSGTCQECPVPSSPVPAGLEGKLVSMSLWAQREINGRKKYGLWQIVKPIEQLAKELADDLSFMKRHINTAAVCWEAVKKYESELRPGIDVLSFEDYQRNFEVSHSEMPTSLGYSANTLPLAMYPVVVKFRRHSTDSTPPPIETGAIIFLSDDLHHDPQQIEQMEKR